MKKRTVLKSLINTALGLIITCSAFFYGSIDADASNSVSFSDTYSVDLDTVATDEQMEEFGYDKNATMVHWYLNNSNINFGTVDLNDYFTLNDDLFYSCDISMTYNFTGSRAVYCWPGSTNLKLGSGSFYLGGSDNTLSTSTSKTTVSTVYFYGSSASGDLSSIAMCYSPDAGNLNFTIDVVLRFSNLQVVSAGDTDSYELGYNAGYSDGLSHGESTGYNSGYADGYEAGESSGYESGFQAGSDSVDTQSYYDSGYNSGYSVGYSTGYDSGYDAGYQDAMSRVEGWGADTSSYPSLVFSGSTGEMAFYFGYLNGSFERERMSTFFYLNNIKSYDINHNYCIEISDYNVNLNNSSGVSVNAVAGINASGVLYLIDDLSSSNIYLRGTDLSSLTFVFRVSGYGTSTSSYIEPTVSFNFKIFDMGPTGDTQNHIANQTDQLTNGFDSSGGQDSANSFADGVAEYDAIEGSLFTSAKSGLSDYEFFDPSSVPAVVTGISFVTATMTGIFNSMGGVSGSGIVLSVLFSVIIVSIVAGLYRYFVSSGKSGKSGKGGTS